MRRNFYSYSTWTRETFFYSIASCRTIENNRTTDSSSWDKKEEQSVLFRFKISIRLKKIRAIVSFPILWLREDDARNEKKKFEDKTKEIRITRGHCIQMNGDHSENILYAYIRAHQFECSSKIVPFWMERFFSFQSAVWKFKRIIQISKIRD